MENIGDRFFSRALASPALYLSGELLLPNAKLTGAKFNIDLSEANWERWLKQGKEFLMVLNIMYPPRLIPPLCSHFIKVQNAY